MFPQVSYKQCDISNGFRTDKLPEIIETENIEKIYIITLNMKNLIIVIYIIVGVEYAKGTLFNFQY